MMTHESDFNFHPRKARKIGDVALFYGFMNTDFLKNLFFKPDQAWWNAIKHYFGFISSLLAYCMAAFFRYRFSSLTSGLGATIMGLSFMLVYNSVYVWKIFVPILMFATPALPFFKEVDEIERLILEDVHSRYLLIYAGVFTALSLIHTIVIYAGFGGRDLSKRGISWIHTILSKFMRINEFFICAFIEPCIVIGLGAYMFMVFQDYYFAAFLWTSAANEIWLQLKDKSYQVYHQTILNA